MMWREHEAKARFGEFLEASVRESPQVVMRPGPPPRAPQADR